MQHVPYDHCSCVFCRTGKEASVARYLETRAVRLRALPVFQRYHRKKDGRKFESERVLFPGYVFIYSAARVAPGVLDANADILCLLTDSDGNDKLAGDDLKFAEWLLEHEGMLGVSKVYCEGDRIRVTSGPLVDCRGDILKVDKHSRNCLVEFHFTRNVFRAWLAFDFVESASGEAPLLDCRANA